MKPLDGLFLIFSLRQERALATGRVVPADVLREAIEQVPTSVKILAPKVRLIPALELYGVRQLVSCELLWRQLLLSSHFSYFRQTTK
jgi:hypothetical protein